MSNYRILLLSFSLVLLFTNSVIKGKIQVDSLDKNESLDYIFPQFKLTNDENEIGAFFYSNYYLPKSVQYLTLKINNLSFNILSFGRVKIMIDFKIEGCKNNKLYDNDELMKRDNNCFNTMEEYLPLISIYLKENPNPLIEDLTTYSKISNIIFKDDRNRNLKFQTAINKIIYTPDSYISPFNDPESDSLWYSFFAGHNLLLSIPYKDGNYKLEFILDNYFHDFRNQSINLEIPLLFCIKNTLLKKFTIESLNDTEYTTTLYNPRKTKSPIDRYRPEYGEEVLKITANGSSAAIIPIKTLNDKLYCGEIIGTCSIPLNIDKFNLILFTITVPLSSDLNYDFKECDYPIPISIYEALKSVPDVLVPPVLEVHLFNNSDSDLRISAEVEIEGLTFKEIKDLILSRNSLDKISFNPILIQDKLKGLLEPRTYNLRCIVRNTDSRTILREKTFRIRVLPNDTMIFTLINESTGAVQTYYRFLTIWLKRFESPEYNSFVHQLIEKSPLGYLSGYDEKAFKELKAQNPAYTPAKFSRTLVSKIYSLLQERNFKYSNETFDLGRSANQTGQRIKYPETTFRQKRGNCIDLTLLFASIIDLIQLNPRIVIIPGHAFVGWETWDGSGLYEYVEMTMIDSEPFEKAYTHAQNVVATHLSKEIREIRFVDIKKCKAQGIYNPIMDSSN